MRTNQYYESIQLQSTSNGNAPSSPTKGNNIAPQNHVFFLNKVQNHVSMACRDIGRLDETRYHDLEETEYIHPQRSAKKICQWCMYKSSSFDFNILFCIVNKTIY